MKRCNTCIKYEVINTLCKKCKELNEFDALMSGDAIELPKIDMGSPFVTKEEAQEHYGQGVTPEEKQALWSEDDGSRMDVIGSNGNDGAAYGNTYGIGQVCKSLLGKLK